MKNLAGPCENCGYALGTHSKRQLLACQRAFSEWLKDMAILVGIGTTLFRIFHNPKGLTEEVNKISATYTDGIKALIGEKDER